MEEIREDILKNNSTDEAPAEERNEPAGTGAPDDDIQYTFVVPKGEIYQDPDLIPEPVVVEPEPAEESSEEPPKEASEPEKTIVADRRRFTEEVNMALEDAAEADEDESFDPDGFFNTYKAADPTGNTIIIEPPVYDATGLSDDDIEYTFVVPKGEIYKEPDPEEERAAKEAEKARRAAAAAEAGRAEILSAETKVVERSSGNEEVTRYGLPVNLPEMGELAQKQEARRIYKQRKRNRFRTRFYVLITCAILLIAWLIISTTSIFTIDAIVVQGNSHYTAEEIINIGHATSGRNIVYQANIKETKEYLEKNPYIKRAEVRRRLPSTLVIKVTERQERLAFKYDDDYLVMDEEGILLRKTRNTPKTTIIQGVVVSRIKLGEQIGTENSKDMERALELIKTMISSDLYFVKADISNVKTIKAYIYNTLVVKADYDTLIENMENGKLHLVMEKLFADGIERGTITFLEDGSASFMPIF